MSDSKTIALTASRERPASTSSGYLMLVLLLVAIVVQVWGIVGLARDNETMLHIIGAVVAPFALLFITTTLAVRVVILRVRGGGNPLAAAATQRATLLVSAVSPVIIGVLTMTGWLERAVLIAAVPGLLTAAIVAARPPSPSRLRTLGWSLVAVSTLTTAIVIAIA